MGYIIEDFFFRSIGFLQAEYYSYLDSHNEYKRKK